MASTSLEPFYCNTYAVLETFPKRVLRCKNKKLTAYLERRNKFRSVRPPTLTAHLDHLDIDREWYEFRIGSIDKRDLYVLFQTEKRPSAFRQSGKERDGPLRVACEAFARRIIFGAIQTVISVT